MEFRILGPLEVLVGGRAVMLGGLQRRSTLAILVLNLNRVVSSDRLIDELWGDSPPPTAVQTVRVHVSQIRKVVGSDLIRTLPAGYVLESAPERLDARRFEGLVDEGIAALGTGDIAAAAGMLRDALALWRGPALADFVYEPFAQSEIARLEDLRLAALEARIDADLALGSHVELVSELKALIPAHPTRERFRGQLMVALYRAGRQSEALAAYREARDAFVEELGVEPSGELRGLERAILHQEDPLHLSSWSPAPPPPPSPVRKTVTVLQVDLGFTDVAGQDPEAFGPRLAGPVERVRNVVARHEGTVVAQVADVVIAAFGLPVLHEDDALRAARVAVSLQEHLTGFEELRPRMGIATGEVVDTGAAMPMGSVAARAARLGALAEPNGIVLDDATRQLIAHAVRISPLEGAPGFRLRALVSGAPPFARRLEAPLIGRQAELGALRAAFEATVAARRPALLVVAGPPGIGKSRLTAELVSELAAGARVLVGRCLSYGQDITLWPLREMIREAAGDDTREALDSLLRDQRDGAAVVDRVAAALVLPGSERSVDESGWAFRRLFEALAASQPHVLVVEDAHWAEPALLDLLDEISRQARAVPLLVLCVARPELLAARSEWAADAIELAPLSWDETAALIDALPGASTLGPTARRRVLTLAEGNPFFAEQLVALMAVDGSDALPAVEPTIQAILAARLDRLGPGERMVAERAAVVGREFTLEALAQLLPPGAAGASWRHLEALNRRMLVQPDRPVLPGDSGFRFQHALLHDVAYRRLPKALRAELHERIADWLESQAGGRIAEFEEFVGYHLESVCRYRRELGEDEHAVSGIAGRAAARLAAAGRRAFQRTDFDAAAGLLSRAVELLPTDDPATVELLTIIGASLGPLGELERQAEVLDEAVRRAARVGDRGGERHARVERRWARARREPERDTPGQLRRYFEHALRISEEVGDAVGAARAAVSLADTLKEAGEAAAAEAMAEKALAFAGRSGSEREVVGAHGALGGALCMGPTPVPQAIVCCERLLATAPDVLVGTVAASGHLGILHAMNGQFGEARRLVGHARDLLESIGHLRYLALSARWAGRVEVLAGELGDAERIYSDGLRIARQIGESGLAQSLGACLAEVLCLQGRADEAARALDAVPEPRQGHSTRDSAYWCAVRGRVLALQGDLAEAERLVRLAAAVLADTDLLDLRGDVQVALAEVLWADGRVDEASAAHGDAVVLYERKGNVAAVALARRRLPLNQDR